MSTNSNNKRCNIYFCEIKSKMGFMKHFIRDGIGIAGKTLMNAADVYSGYLRLFWISYWKRVRRSFRKNQDD